MPAASEPLTPATTVLKLSKAPSAICRAVPPFGASALTYSKCLNPAGYFKSPNSDTPCRQFLSSANAMPIERGHLSSAATVSRVEPSSDLRFIRPSSHSLMQQKQHQSAATRQLRGRLHLSLLPAWRVEANSHSRANKLNLRSK